MNYARTLIDIMVDQALKDIMVMSVPNPIGNAIIMHTIKRYENNLGEKYLKAILKKTNYTPIPTKYGVDVVIMDAGVGSTFEADKVSKQPVGVSRSNEDTGTHGVDRKHDDLARSLSFASFLLEESSKRKVNFRTLEMKQTEFADVLIPMLLVLEVKFKSTLYGYFLGMKVAFLDMEGNMMKRLMMVSKLSKGRFFVILLKVYTGESSSTTSTPVSNVFFDLGVKDGTDPQLLVDDMEFADIEQVVEVVEHRNTLAKMVDGYL
nr:hypothetical protein [Tanacetum cinerariifolium]